MRRASSSRCWPAVNCRPSARQRWTSIASTSRRTLLWSGASSPFRSPEPSIAHTIDILRGLRDRYEAHHRITITDEALVAAAQMADRYISDRFLPDKAIDLIDEAGARLRIRRMTAPPDLREFDEKVAAVRLEKEAAIDAQDFERAAGLRDDEKKLLTARAEREAQWKSGDLDVVAEVDEEIIAEVLSTATGIPVFKLTEEESARLLRMEEEIGKRYIGQHDAVKALSRSIRRTRAGLKDPKRPSGSFIFAGPSGVGKTELTKALTEFLFGDEDALIQLDMSEYSEKHTASRLFGSPPGYVGYEEGGQLTEKVRRKPFSVVLFDEVEKAHPDIFNSLLQILDEGRLTDAQGRVVDFKNTVIVMTTNLGTRDIAKSVSLGFSGASGTEGGYDKMKAKVTDELKQHFRPEFLEPGGRDRGLPPAQSGGHRADRRPDGRPDRDPAEGQGHGHRAHARGKDADRQAWLRPGAGRSAAASGDSARCRGPARGEDLVHGAEAGRDRRGRRRRPGLRAPVHLHRHSAFGSAGRAAGGVRRNRGGLQRSPEASANE